MKNFFLFLVLTMGVFALYAQKSGEELVDIWPQTLQIEGQNFFVINFKNADHWHTYWKNPGESGRATEFKVLSPVSWKRLGEVAKGPVPERIIEGGDITVYAYSGEYSYFFPLTEEQLSSTGPIEIDVHWLVCKNICIPGNKSFVFSLTQQGKLSIIESPKNPAINLPASELEKRWAAVPKLAPIPNDLEFFLAKGSIEGEFILGHIWQNVSPAAHRKNADIITLSEFSPFGPGKEQSSYDPKTKTLFGYRVLKWEGLYQTPELPLPEGGTLDSPVSFEMLVQGENDFFISQEFKTYDESGGDGFIRMAKSYEAIGELEEGSNPEGQHSFLLILFFAFLGGLVLNLMPCVLPVISLKLFALIAQSHQNRKRILRHNLAYSAGVVLSFMALASVVALIKFSGESIGWGFQMQSPIFVVAMILIIFLLALNFFGLFEFRTPGGKKLGQVSLQKGTSGDFLSGILATILATPCSAPFLGTALTFAFSGSYLSLFLVLLFVAIGLSFPFLLVGLFPRCLHWLPRPGIWMNTLKSWLGFSLLLTCVWLVYVLNGLEQNSLYLTYVLLQLACLFFGVYSYQKISRTRFGKLLTTGLILASLGGTFYLLSELPHEQAQSGSNSYSNGLQWGPWSKEALQKNLSEKSWTFIDFTAEWCLTCKVNKKLVLERRSFAELVENFDLELMRGDWTKRDDKIANFLKLHGAVSVPAYFLQDPNGKIIFLGETISVKKIKDVISPQILEEGPSVRQ